MKAAGEEEIKVAGIEPGKVRDIPMFFIVGRPRSGTTLLRTLFDAHPQVNIPLECKFVLDLYPRYGKTRNWTAKDLENFQKDLSEQLLFKTWKTDEEELRANLLECRGKNSYGTVCKTVYATYRSFFEKAGLKWFGDKNPGYTIYTKKLLKIFPDARFIHIVRDYRDNLVSIKDVDFELPVPSLVTMKWKLFYRKFLKDSREKPESYYLIRYEDLVSEPVEEFRRLCDFLGLPFNRSVFDFTDKKDEIFKAYPKEFVTTYHANLLNKVNSSRVGVWKKKLTEKEIRVCDHTVGTLAEEAGYERKYKKTSPATSIRALPGIFLARFLAFLTVLVDRLPYKLRINILNKWPLRIAMFYLRIFRPGKVKEVHGEIFK